MIKMKRQTGILTLTAILSGIVTIAAHADDNVSMTFAHSENPNAMIAAEAFKSMVEDRSGGSISVNNVIHHAIGSDRDIIDQMRIGEVEFYVPGFHSLAALVPEVQIFSAPYLFNNRAEFFELMNDDDFVSYVRDWILDKTDNSIRLLGAAENSLRHLYSVHGPLNTPEDLGPLDLRVPPTPLNLALWDALGVGSVVGMSGAERNQAIQTGVINAIEGSVAGAWGAGHMSTLDHVTLTGHVYSYMPYIISQDFYENLTDEQQTVITESARLAIWVQNGHSITVEQRALKEIEEAGNTVTALTPGEMAQWQEIAEPVGRQFIEERVDPAFAERTYEALASVRERLAR